MQLRARRPIAARVWPMLAEPFHLPDWWPGYSGVEPDRRGLAPGARWKVSRAAVPGLLRGGGGEGVIVIDRVDPERALAWTDVRGRYRVEVELAAGEVALALSTSPWRALDLRSYPREALIRLERLCDTAGA